MAENVAVDHSSALADARNPKVEQSSSNDLPVHQHGSADNYSGAPNSGSADNYADDGDHTERLATARSSKVKDAINDAKEILALASPMGALSLLKHINFIGDIPYAAGLGAALLKDILDLIDAETVILPALFSMFCTIFIFMMMLIVGSNGKKNKNSKLIKKVLSLIGAGIADSIPGLDYLPIETMAVIYVYVQELVERKNASKE